MAEKIGFAAESQQPAPRNSVVQVYFAGRNMTLAYYNDRFDLHRGDMVYVEGKLEGMRGCVVDVNYNFKIKVSDYRRVIARVDTDVHGQFFLAGSHFLTFDRAALPGSRVLPWFRAPAAGEETFVTGSDGTVFRLDDLQGMQVNRAIAERGHNYYMENRVRYLSLDGARGYAIVEGRNAYEVEFLHDAGEIRDLVCSCICSYTCKHEVATMLQLRDLLARIETHYADEYARAGYFAAIDRETLLTFALNGKETGSITL